MWYMKSLLPTAGVIMTFPLWVLTIIQEPKVPITAIEAQGWLIAVVGASMGLVKIALWLRNYKEQKNGNGGVELANFQRILDKVTINEERLVENQKILSDHQQKLAENQLKALENHSRLLEAMTLLKLQLQTVENNILSSQEKRTFMAMTEAKEFIRDTLGGK